MQEKVKNVNGETSYHEQRALSRQKSVRMLRISVLRQNKGKFRVFTWMYDIQRQRSGKLAERLRCAEEEQRDGWDNSAAMVTAQH